MFSIVKNYKIFFSITIIFLLIGIGLSSPVALTWVSILQAAASLT